MEPGQIASTYLLSILRILAAMGYSRERALRSGDIAHNDLLNPKHRVPMESLRLILDDAAADLGEPNIGLQVGYRFRVSTFTETGSILALCGSLAEAAQINSLYQPLAESAGRQTFERRDEGACMVYEPHFEDDDAYRHVTELVVTGYVTTANWLSWGYERGVDSVDFRHSAPPSLEGYASIIGPNLRFGQPENIVWFNPKMVDQPLPTSNPEKLTLVRQRLDFIMQRAQAKSGLRERVSAEILAALRDQCVSFDAVARNMGMSQRTLRRNLAEEKISYRGLLEETRKSLCENYMKDGRSLTEIAQLLGYNDQSAFTRAFKKWYGVIPSQYKIEPIRL